MTTDRSPSLTEQVMDYVRRAVDSGEMITGVWYSVYQLSQVLGISRSPVREGLLRLEEAGLLRFTRNRGFQIVAATPADVAEIFALRLAIEPAAAYRAALHRTNDELAELIRLVSLMNDAADKKDEDNFFTLDRTLHAVILQAGHSIHGTRLVEQLGTYTRALGHPTVDASRTLRDILAEQVPVLTAIRSRDARAARRAMSEHLRSTGHLLLTRALVMADDDTDPVTLWDRYVAGS